MTIMSFYGTSLHGSSCSLFLRVPFGKEGKWFGCFFYKLRKKGTLIQMKVYFCRMEGNNANSYY